LRKIKKSQLGPDLIRLLDEHEPFERDIGIVDDDDNLLAAVICDRAYDFFLRKVEEAEDLQDLRDADEFNYSGEKT